MKSFLGAFVLLAISLSGCGEAQIKPDPSLPAMDAHYPTAEFMACGKRWHGLGICETSPQGTLDRLNFSVQGYLDGDMRVYAVSSDPNCQFDQHLTYVKNQLVSIPLPKVSHSCTFGITVTPHFPGQDKQSSLQVHSLEGFLRVRNISDDTLWNGDTFFFPENTRYSFSLPTFFNAPTLASIRGCGIRFDSLLSPKDGRFVLDLTDIGIQANSQICEIEGVLLGLPSIRFSRLVSIYRQSFVPLPKPVVIFDRDQITVYADSTVSAMILDDQVILSSVGEFAFDPNKEHVFRLFTIMARSIIGEYKPYSQEWEWK